MITALCQCKVRVYVDSETGHKFNSNSTDDPHRCQPNPISLYFMFNNIPVPYSQNKVASMIVEEAVRVGMDPYTVRTQKRGDKLYLIR